MSTKLRNEITSVTRVAITPVSASALAFWVGTAVTYSAGRQITASCLSALAACCSILAAIFLFSALKLGKEKCLTFSVFSRTYTLGAAFTLICFAATFTGIMMGCVGAYEFHALNSSEPAAAGEHVFCLQEDLIPRDNEYEVLAECLNCSTLNAPLVLLSFDSDPGILLNGECISTRTSLKSCSLESDFAWSKGAQFKAEVFSFTSVCREDFISIILDFRRQAIESFADNSGDQGGVLQALVCGYRGGIELSGEYEDYKLVGLAHIIAVSGSHLAIVANLVHSVAARISLPAQMRIFLVITCIAAYFFFSGCSISALRSVAMVSISTTSLMAGRRGSALNALSVCVVAFIALDPKTAVSVSFILSAGSTLGIILFASLFISLFGVKSRNIRTFVVEPIALTLASSLTTQLYSAALFAQYSLVSLPANIVAAPLFSIGCICGLVAAMLSLMCPALSVLASGIASLSVMPMQFACTALAIIPYAAVPFHGSTVVMLILSAIICACLYCWWPSRKELARVIASLVCVLLALVIAGNAAVSLNDEILMLDVGQGDCFVIRSQGVSLMIDTGNRSSLLKQALSRNGIYHLDAVLITHADDDHCGSLTDLAEVVSIDAVYLFEDANSCSCDNCTELCLAIRALHGSPEARSLSYGDKLQIGDFAARVVWPKQYSCQGGNGDSLSLLVQHETSGFDALFVGDAERDQLGAMLERQTLGSIDVYKVGHHGSYGAISEELISVLKPSVSLISVGEGNWYGHPHAAVVNALEDAGSIVLRTDETGDATLRFKDDEIIIKP